MIIQATAKQLKLVTSAENAFFLSIMAISAVGTWLATVSVWMPQLG
jgi:hypothetical protein